MDAYSPIPQEDWLALLQRNWLNSKHWVVDGDDLDEELWLMCDPNVDPMDARSVEDLLLLFFHPRQKLPDERFKATMRDGNLKIKGLLEGHKVTLTFRPDKKKSATFYAYLDGSRIEFDSQKATGDMFFHDFAYEDPQLKKGDKVLYKGQLWRFVKWTGALRIERCDRNDDTIECRNALVQSCLRLEKNVEPRLPHTSSSSQPLHGSSSLSYHVSISRPSTNNES